LFFCSNFALLSLSSVCSLQHLKQIVLLCYVF
jgi:hypothetical protein